MTAIETVKGPVEVDDLGPTLMHEHVFVLSTEHVQNYGDGSWWDEEARAADAVAKLTALRAKGITTIVDPTVWGIGRYIPRIQRINLGSRGFAAASSGTRITFTRRTMPPSIPTGVRGTDMTKLAELFQASGGKPIRWDGESIQMMHEILDIAAGSVLKIEFVHANSDRAQAIRIKSRGGTLHVNGESLGDIVLWADTSPTIIEAAVELKGSEKPLSIRLWNAWKDGDGTMQAWIGNSGLIVSAEPDGQVVLRCSDGYDDPSFKDLVVRVAVK